MKVEADQSYEIPKGNGVLTEFEVPLTVQKPYYKQSLHTSHTIDTEGMQFNGKWAYGMGTWYPENYWQYSFTDKNPVFFNAGTEEVKLIQQKESLIEVVVGQTAPWFEIVDDAGNVFRLNKTVNSGDVLRIRGDSITLNGSNVMDDTNFTFLIARRG